MKENSSSAASGQLDKVDWQILAHIQQSGRISNSQLSKQVNLSETPCWRRWKNLEEQQFINGYTAVLNRKKLGFTMSGFTQVSFGNHDQAYTDAFEHFVMSADWIPLCHCVAGSTDYWVQIIATDLDEYYQRLNQLRRLEGVSSLNSSLSVKEIKNSTIVPIVRE